MAERRVRIRLSVDASALEQATEDTRREVDQDLQAVERSQAEQVASVREQASASRRTAEGFGAAAKSIASVLTEVANVVAPGQLDAIGGQLKAVAGAGLNVATGGVLRDPTALARQQATQALGGVISGGALSGEVPSTEQLTQAIRELTPIFERSVVAQQNLIDAMAAAGVRDTLGVGQGGFGGRAHRVRRGR